MNGVLLINKPSGPSSFDVLRGLKKQLGTSKMGYLGTLDPLASGLLIVFVGKSTKLIRYCEGLDKHYRVEFLLGMTSDSYDTTGNVMNNENSSLPDEQFLSQHMQAFVGDIWQIQPSFSALKFQGKRAYEHARDGKVIDLGKRQVRIEHFLLLSFSEETVVADVSCSAGTYVRSLVHELGESLGCGAVMSALCRMGIGEFRLKDAVSPEQVTTSSLHSPESFLDVLEHSLPALAKEKAYLLKKTGN